MNLHHVIEETVSGLGFECVLIERSGRGLIRVYIDRAEGIGVEDCALVSNQLTRVFAVEHIEFERLEISSPGLDRPLVKKEDFERFKGSEIKLRWRGLIENRRRATGTLVGLDGESVHLQVEGMDLRVPFEDIEKANLVPEI